MTARTTTTTVTFARPFVLAGIAEEFPAGDYVVETDEDILEGLSFTAYRRTQTIIHLPRAARLPGRTGSLSVSPDALDAALARDASAASNSDT